MKLSSEQSLAIALNATVHGWLDRGLIKNKDEAIAILTEASLLIALQLNGAGGEKTAIKKARKYFNEQAEFLAEQINNGIITGSSRGGFDR
jgi:hypothetical protein